MDENIGEGAMRGQLRKVFPNDSAKRIQWKALEKKKLDVGNLNILVGRFGSDKLGECVSLVVLSKNI